MIKILLSFAFLLITIAHSDACTGARLDGLDRVIEEADNRFQSTRRKYEQALREIKGTVPGYAINIFSFRGEKIHSKEQEMDSVLKDMEKAKSDMFAAAAKINYQCFDGVWPRAQSASFQRSFGQLKARQVQMNTKIRELMAL